MATRGRKPASRRKAQPKTIDLKATTVASDAKPGTEKKAASVDTAGKSAATASAVTGSAASQTSKASVAKTSSTESDTTKPASASPPPRSTETGKPDDKSSAPGETKKPEVKAGETAKSGGVKTPEMPQPKTGSASQPKRSAGFGSLAASAILGGVVTAGGLGIIGQMESAPSIPVIGSLYGAGSASEAVQKIPALEEQVTTLSTKIEEVSSRSAPDQTVDLTAIEGRVSQLETAGAEASASLTTVQSNVEKLDSLTKRVAAIAEASSEGVQNGGDSQVAIQGLETRIAEISDRLKALEGGGSSVNAEEIAAISGKIAEFSNSLAAFKAAETGNNEQIQANFTQKLTDQASQLSKLGERQDAVEKVLNEQVVNRFDEVTEAAKSAKASEKIARSVAVSALQSAITNGTPYLSALASVETLSGITPETQRLRELTESGTVPTLVQIQSGFSTIAQSLITPDEAGEDDGGLLNRFVSSAKSLVTVRPAGPMTGNSPRAVVSRIESNVADGKLEAVAEDWALLPEASKTIGAQWLDGLNRRLETNKLLEAVLEQATNSADQG